jgi:hypothetical protein
MTEIEQIQELCKTNLAYLYKEVLKYDRWNDKLHGNYPGDPEKGIPPGIAYYLANSGPRKLILVPRNHLKSTVVTVAWAIQRILIDPNVRILINNAKFDTARAFVQTIQAHLDTNSPLSKIFGEFRSNKLTWNKDNFIISQRTMPRAQPTVMAASIDTILNGMHFDIIIHDDLVEPNNVRTREQIDKTIEFFKDSFNQIDKGGQIVVIGTRWASQDLYGHILATACKSVNGKQLEKGQGAEWFKHTSF